MSDFGNEMLLEAIQIAVEKAKREIVLPRTVPADVVSYSLGVCTVHVDGDESGVNIPAQLIVPTITPDAGDRVMVRFEPPHAVFVVGVVR